MIRYPLCDQHFNAGIESSRPEFASGMVPFADDDERLPRGSKFYQTILRLGTRRSRCKEIIRFFDVTGAS